MNSQTSSDTATLFDAASRKSRFESSYRCYLAMGAWRDKAMGQGGYNPIKEEAVLLIKETYDNVAGMMIVYRKQLGAADSQSYDEAWQRRLQIEVGRDVDSRRLSDFCRNEFTQPWLDRVIEARTKLEP